ncbi:MAG TPA: DUF3160 domain-containing protein [Bacteroides sp.]|nr:DUF3160 domain-containing protein [Bacteroides sp.]
MKRLISLIVPAALVFAGAMQIKAQSTFSPEAYMEFLQSHQDYSASALLDDYPPKTVYYSDRQYPADLGSVPWYDTLDAEFGFTEDENELLRNHFFMVSERFYSYDWASAFISLYSSDLPLFLSSDFILNTLHNSYDAILQTIEWQFLEPNLLELLHAMYDHFPQVASAYASDERYSESLKDVDLFIAVPLSLAEGAEYLPQFDSREKYDEVMAAAASEQMTYMKLFTADRVRRIDFSQFTPRGHYNKEIYTPDGRITLEKYFRAMMWLGRIDFLLTAPPENPWEPNWTEEELRRMQLNALLLNKVLYGCGEMDNLLKHEEIISFMVGPDDNLTPGELKSMSDGMLSGPGDLFDAETFGLFSEALNASDDYGQKIMSNFFLVDPWTADPGQLPVSYKVLGQKFLIDSYVFSQVVFDRIVYQGEKIWRPLPDPLDAMAALGNEDALALLEDQLESCKYASSMAGLKYLIDSYDEEFWEQSLYNTWLGAIRSLNPPASSGKLPYFMQTTAWHHEKLNTQLTSWAQLRHDNILYGKQSYTGGTACSYPYTYVEPYPDFYGKLEIFARNASRFFEGVLTGEQVELKERIVAYYDNYAEIMDRLAVIAQKELDRQQLSESEVTFLKTMINEYMASGPSVTGWFTDLFFDVEKGLWMDFTVADVHTQPTTYEGTVIGKVMHVGNGLINMGVFLAPNPCNPEHLMAFAGPVSSFHTMNTLDFKRLTDQEWEEMFRSDLVQPPDRPDWVGVYIADREGRSYPEGKALKGTLYTGTGEIEEPGQEMDYLLLFPNPVSDEAHLRFVLNRETSLEIGVFDVSGRHMYADHYPLLHPAEHDLILPVSGWQQGLYLVRVRTGTQSLVRQLVIR